MLLHGLRRELRRGRVRQPTEQGRAERLRMSPRDGGGKNRSGRASSRLDLPERNPVRQGIALFPQQMSFLR